MKLLAIILSIYTISLSALPCDDVIVDNQQISSISQDCENDNFIDLCSPLCICICCTGVVLEHTIQQEILIVEIPIKEVGTHFDVSFFNNYSSQIYQPPKV